MEKRAKKRGEIFAGCAFLWIGALGFLFQDLLVNIFGGAIIFVGGFSILRAVLGNGMKFTSRPSEGLIIVQFMLGGVFITLFVISLSLSLLYPSFAWTLLFGLYWGVMGTLTLTVRLRWPQPPLEKTS